MGGIEKGAHGVGVQQVEVRVIVEPGLPQRHRLRVELDHAVGVAGQLGHVGRANVHDLTIDLAGRKGGDALGHQRQPVVHLAHQVPGAIGRVRGDTQAPCEPAGPLVLVVQPGAHTPLAGRFHAGADPPHPRSPHVRRPQPDARVHKKAAPAPRVHQRDLPAQLLRVKVVVPRPERYFAVLLGRIPKLLDVQLAASFTLVPGH